MFDTILNIVAPHHCYDCQVTGTLLCENCKYNITSEPFDGCIACGHVAGPRGICSSCRVPYHRAWCVAERSGVTKQLINDFKFENVYAAHNALADILRATIGELPQNTVIVPIPTVASHIRQRGYDHAHLMARSLARSQHVAMQPLLQRTHSLRQRGLGRADRMKNAKTAFRVDAHKIDVSRPHLIVDDIVTTGATLHYGAKALKDAGVQEIWVAAVARQPLD